MPQNETPAQAKQRLRREAAVVAQGFDAAYLARSDAAILQQVCALPAYRAAHMVFCYISVGGEPDTRALIEKMLAEGKRVCVPRCLPAGVMEARCIASLAEVAPARFGLLEPDETARHILPEEVDLVILPCVSADKEGRRLGNGGGFYDRYMAQLAAPSVCLCRGRLLAQHLPEEAFDRRVDRVVTEDGIWP